MSGIGIVIMSIYLTIDTQLILGGKRYQIEIDDYIIGVIYLYTDIVAFFLVILQTLSCRQ